MRDANTSNYKNLKILTGDQALKALDKLLTGPSFNSSKKFILADNHTLLHCLPLLESKVGALQKACVIEIPAGEVNKDIEVCRAVWMSLSQLEADRDSVLINLGGGVVSDIGAFVASTFMRGIRYVNVPTTLMAMVDAAIGGKTGIDLEGLKNMVGTFYLPEAVCIWPSFLNTLPKAHLHSGYAEILKHSLIADPQLWKQLQRRPFSEIVDWLPFIRKSVEIKSAIVNQDLYETGSRKVLNFGHTVGHAIESYSLQMSKKHLLHGEAIAAGMICESYLSNKMTGLSDDHLDQIAGLIHSEFPKVKLPGPEKELLQLMRSDKKNKNETIHFTLLMDIGQVMINQTCPESLIIESLRFYNSIMS
jgi:3-dehydroquinate synthase